MTMVTSSASMAAVPRVIVLHGWGMSAYATRYWCRALARAGFAPRPFAYASLRRSLDDNAARLAQLVQALPGAGPVHLVGHSLGGLTILQCLARHAVADVGRVVMVGTPYQGSDVARSLQRHRVGRALLGNSLGQWRGVGHHELPEGLELGVIAGTRPVGLGRVVGRIDGPHDGTVTLAETQVPFAKDHRVLHVTHTEMLISPQVTAEVVHFLRDGRFRPA